MEHLFYESPHINCFIPIAEAAKNAQDAEKKKENDNKAEAKPALTPEEEEQKRKKEEEKKAREEALKDPDRDFLNNSERYGTLLLDIIKLLVVLVLSFLIAGIPWFVGKRDGSQIKYRFAIDGEQNLCYWYGDTGLLDDKNPCKYRGYASRTMNGKQCISWRGIMDTYGPSKYKAGSLEKKMLKMISESNFKAHYEDDYKAPVCRRIFKRNPFNTPYCFEKPDIDGELPKLEKCWIYPCTTIIANKCYAQLARNYGES